MKTLSRILLVLILFNLYHATFARPRIGVVLSGGGARGTAHIGALRALEELQIPIDFIAANSMGSVIGGLYSSGMSPDEMQEWFETADWNDLFNDEPHRRDQSFRSKQLERNYMSLELGLGRGGPKFPGGAISGDKFLATLRQFSLAVAEVDNFNELPIPFAAMATDINTGDPVKLRSGDLPLAMRASMSVPGVFAPVYYEDKLLVDGLVVANLPVSLVQEMGAEIIIAIDVAGQVEPLPEGASALAVTGQMLKIMGAQGDMRQKALLDEDDIYILVELGDASSGDFVSSPQNIGNGYDAVMAIASRLTPLAISSAEHNDWLENQRLPRERSLTVDFIEFPDTGGIPEKTVANQVKTRPGAGLDINRVNKDSGAIKQLDAYQLVDPQFIKRDEQWGVSFETIEKTWGPNYLNFGLNINASNDSNTEIDLLLSYRMRELNRLGGELFLESVLGSNERYHVEYYQPLEKNRLFFLAPRLEAFRYDDFISDSSGASAGVRGRNYRWGFDAGMRLGESGELRIGYVGNDTTLDVGTGIATENESFKASAVRAILEIDTFDSAYFPTSGMRVGFAYLFADDAIGSDANYSRFETYASMAIPIGKYTVIPKASFGGRLGPHPLPLLEQPTLGGFTSLAGVEQDFFRDQYALDGGVFVTRRMGEMPPGLGRAWYLGGSAELGGVFNQVEDIEFDKLFWGGSAFLGVESRFGALYIGGGYTEEQDPNFFLLLGQPF